MSTCAGALGVARLVMATEEHGNGRQLFRFRLTPRVSTIAATIAAGLAALAVAAALDHAWAAAAVLGVAGAALAALLGAIAAGDNR